MDIDIRKLAFAIAVCLLALWRVKRGFKNGILKEIVNILSGAISLVCVALVFYALLLRIKSSSAVRIAF